MKFSRSWITYSLGCAIGVVGAYDVSWVYRYWPAIRSLYEEGLTWFTIGMR